MKMFKPKKQQPLTRRQILNQRKQVAKQLENSTNPSSFKRSRTLSSRNLTTGQNKSDRQESWGLRHKRRKLVLILSGVTLLIILVLLIISNLITKISVSSTDTISLKPDKYSRTLETYLETRPLERLRFLVNKQALTNYFNDKTPEVKAVSVVGGSKLAQADLVLSFRKPLVQWSSDGKIYYVDDEGITFEDSHFDTPDVIVNDQSGVPAYAGQEIVNRRFLSFVGQAVSGFNESNLAVKEVILPPDTVRQVEIVLEGRPYKIKMTIDREVAAQVAQTVHAISALSSRSLSPEYIDVRVDQSVFYK